MVVDRAGFGRDSGFGSPGCWKRVNASSESSRQILLRSAMKPERFDPAFAVEIETMQSDEEFFSGSEDELANT